MICGCRGERKHVLVKNRRVVADNKVFAFAIFEKRSQLVFRKRMGIKNG
jgi:hypothetical protein